MKEITIGDISILSEDGDTWNELIQVIEKASKAYQKSLKQPKLQKQSWIRRLLSRIR